jgi:hypothetical protein
MGRVYCGIHNRLCCWACDRCPTCTPELGRIGRGDYCRECTLKLRAKGYVWSDYSGDYVLPELAIQPRIDEVRA